MGMQETPKSLRTYLSLVGFFGMLGNAAEIWQSQHFGIAYGIDGGIGICLAFAFFYAAFKLPTLLISGGSSLVRLLWGSAIYRALTIILLVIVGGAKTMDFVGPFLAIAISFYLIGNVRRLAREAGCAEAQ